MIILGFVYVFMVYGLLQANGHDQKSSLTFVIDDTGSMGDDIIQVISKTNEVFDAVLKANSSKIDDFVLVTFNDPGTNLRTITRDKNVFKQALSDINIIPGSGGDCPEYAMSGIELALQKSKPNSFFYVFTDASAKDHRKLETIKSLSQKRSTQVSFLLTGVCGSSADNDYVVYDKLAEATSGQVFHIGKHDINKIINYIIASITEKKTTLSQNVFNSGYGNKISFTVDSKVWDVIVSISGAYPDFDVTTADGKFVETEVIASADSTAIRKIKTKPGVYTVILRSPRRTSVVVTGSTSICFEHGFSAIEPQSLNYTSTLPLPGYKSYLSIALTNKDRDVTLKTVEIRDLNNNVIDELPVTLINGDSQFYSTGPFNPPTEPFKIAINGFTNTGEKVTRVSSTPVQPQKQEIGTQISPVVNILSDPIIVINHGDPVTLKCKLRGYPQPVVTWTDTTGAIYPSNVVPIELPYDYISELTIDKITKNSTITCTASNSQGNQAKSVIVGIKTYFHIIKQPKDIVVEYGASAETELVVDAFPPAIITWYKDDKKITGSDSFNLSPDSSILSIKNMQLKLKGNYSVIVENGNEKKTISFKLDISGIEKPKIDKNVTAYTKKVGLDVDLQCKLLQGKPKPTLYWYILDEFEEKKKLDEHEATVHIDNLKKDDTATYICEAINEIGKDYHTISLDVEYPPSIVLNNKHYNVKENEEVTLICNADGSPLPKVRWFKNSSEISSDSKYRSPYDNILHFRASMEDTGRYTCKASNHLGTVQESVTLRVDWRKKSPIVNILSDPIIVVNHDDAITLKCKLRGYPQPVVTWTDTTGAIYSSKVVPVNLPYDYISELTIDKITKNSTITCKASNSEGNHAKSVIVGIKTYFHITKQPKDIVVEYDTSTEMELVVDAFPRATITWYKDDKQITGSDSFNLSPDSSILSIKNMQLKLKGNYSVKVENGNEKKTISFKVDISGIEKPKIDKNVTVYTKRVGLDVDLQCRLLQGKPKPTLYWYILDEFEEQKKIDENGATVHIDNLKKDDTATYMCEAINEIGKDYHTISLDVEYPPSIVLNNKNYNVKENEQVTFICDADGFPSPKVRWFKNSSEISSDSKYRNPYNNILLFRASIEDTGRYTCEATNYLGTVRESVTLNVYNSIKVKSPEKVLNILVGSPLELPCVADGYPVPEIKWTFSSFDDGYVPPEADFTFRELDSKTVPAKLRPNENNSIVIPRVQLQDEGYYFCVVNNSVESVSVGYEVHVLAVPVIKKSLSDKTLEAVEGDLVLRIPCQADGKPKATILWTLDDRNIASGTEWYDVDEYGTLLIKNVDKKSSGTYKCTAKNSLGSDWKETYVNVQPYPRSSTVTRKELYEEGTSANITCDQPHDKRDLIRWFKNGRLIKIGELSIRNIAISNSGLYSCRVSNILSSHSSHKKVVVGRKPQFDTVEETDIEYSDDAIVYLDCSASGFPIPTVTWTHNGDITKETSYGFGLQMRPTDIGNYICVLSNDFGNISRTYNIIAEDCLIDIENHFTAYRPLIVTPHLQWPVSETVGGSLSVSKNKLIYFYCHEGHILHDKSDFGMVAPAMCTEKQTFLMKKVYVEYNNLKCNKEITPLAKATGMKCNAGNTELLLVGFSVGHQFLKVYEVCFDKDENVTIYATNKIDKFLAGFVPKTPFKYIGSKYLPDNFNDIYECKGKCCFEKRQLVNPKDVSPGYRQLSTYNDLNVSPHWSTCGTENWDEVEKRVRSLAKSLDYSLLVWTGRNSDAGRIPSIITYRSIVEDRQAPRFIWKVVVNLQEREAIAIIQVNVRNLKPRTAASYVLCADICDKVEWMNNPSWRNVKKGYTYCCRLQDFVKAFGYDYVFRNYVRFTKVLRSQNLLPRHSLT